MSDPDHRNPTPGRRPARRDPVLTFFMFVGGIILLLPGLCSLYVIITDSEFRGLAPEFFMFWIAFLLMGYLGITYIKRALS
jgi:drug/metabolite transporter (DMT)-like permease